MHEANANFKFMTLDFKVLIGKSIQVYFKRKEESLNPYVKFFGSRGGNYAIRSDLAHQGQIQEKMKPARMSLNNGHLHASIKGKMKG